MQQIELFRILKRTPLNQLNDLITDEFLKMSFDQKRLRMWRYRLIHRAGWKLKEYYLAINGIHDAAD